MNNGLNDEFFIFVFKIGICRVKFMEFVVICLFGLGFLFVDEFIELGILVIDLGNVYVGIEGL